MKKAPKKSNKGGAPTDEAEKRKQNDAASAKKKAQNTQQTQEKEAQKTKEKESSQLGQQQQQKQEEDKPKTNEQMQAQNKDKKQEKGSGEKNLLGMEGSNVKTKDEHDNDKMGAIKEGDTSGGMQQAIVKGNMQSRFSTVDHVMDGRPIEAARTGAKVPLLSDKLGVDQTLKQVDDNTTKGESLGNMAHGGKKNTDGKNAPRSNPTLSGENMGKTMQGKAPTAGSAGNVSRGVGVGGEGEHQKEAKEQQKAGKPDGAEQKQSKDPVEGIRKQRSEDDKNNPMKSYTVNGAMMGGMMGGGAQGAGMGAAGGMAADSIMSKDKDKDTEKKQEAGKADGAKQEQAQGKENNGPAGNKALEQPQQKQKAESAQQGQQQQAKSSSMQLKPQGSGSK